MAKQPPRNRPSSSRGSQGRAPHHGSMYSQGNLALSSDYARPSAPPKRPKKTKTLFLMSIKTKNLNLLNYIAVGVAALCFLGILVAGANVTLQRNANAQVLDQIRRMEIQNNRLQNQITQARNLDEIEQIARERLGMAEPLPHQVHAVTLIPEVEIIPVFSQGIDHTHPSDNNWSAVLTNLRHFLLSE